MGHQVEQRQRRIHNRSEPGPRTQRQYPPYGNWSFNGNASTGGMNIFSVDAQGGLVLRVHFDGLGREDEWHGNWDDARKAIHLTRLAPDAATLHRSRGQRSPSSWLRS